ncbi:hypothetical protein KIPB_008435, partial [Kipferlia bialata]
PGDTPYAGGLFKAEMSFPCNYPQSPPKLRFTSQFYHPNVYEDGSVCISILHEAGNDALSGETAVERWRPIHTVRTILLSVVSLISDPNISSPANVDAARMFRDNKKKYRRRVSRTVRQSLEECV